MYLMRLQHDRQGKIVIPTSPLPLRFHRTALIGIEPWPTEHDPDVDDWRS
jgi:hypothetical protein